MQLALISAGTALLLCAPAAIAAPTTSPANATTPPPAASAAPNAARGSMRADVRDMLHKAGFTDIRIAPSSFAIRAKDKDGNPVMMSVSPDSFTEISEVDNGNADNTAGGASPSGASEFVAINTGDELSSNVVGLDVYNDANKNIGQIKDIAWNQRGRAQAYILSVGGFLGVGERYVAVNPHDVKVSYNETDKKWHATMNATADELKAAPQFKYDGRWNASRS